MAKNALFDFQRLHGQILKISLLGSFILAGLSGCTDEPVTPKEIIRPVKSIVVADAEQLSDRRFPGRASATQEVNLSFDVNGTLVERPVLVGDTVKQGQLIAKLDQRDFRANLKSAQAELKRDQQNFNRAKELIADGNISKADYDRLEAKLDVSAANLSIATKALADSVLEAPFDGHIANLFVDNFQAVRSKQEIARLLDTTHVEFTVQIPEQLISMISYIRDIQVEFDSNPGNLIPATIKEIGTEASSTTRTYPVTLILEQPDDFTILPGMSGSATGRPEMPEGLMEKGIIVPVAAVFSAGDKSDNFVWVIDENKQTVSRRQVTVGELSDAGIPVTSGLEAGEQVVTAGVNYLRDGQKIRIPGAPRSSEK